MKFNILKRAFSLTELLIVLVVVAVLFAAMAPFMTKRGKGSTPADEPVWMFVKDDPEKSAFYDPGSAALTSTAYVGFNPKYFLDSLKAIEDEEVFIEFGTKISPCIIKSVENNDYTYMILPIRLKD